MLKAGILAAAVLTAGPLLVPAESQAVSWTLASAQTIGGQNLIMNSVFVPAAGDVWTVGYRYGNVGGATEFRTIIEHSTGGGGFEIVPSRDREGAPATNFLEDISGTSSTDLWTVGWSRDPGQSSRTLIEHWDGTSWSFAASADPGLYDDILEGVVAVKTDDVWAVGAKEDDFYQVPMAQHWDGTAWTAVDVPNPSFCSGHSYLTDVTARSGSDLYATGTCQSSSRGGDQGYVVRWNGVRWSLPPVNDVIPTGVNLYGASSFQRTVWFAGFSNDTGAFAMHSKGAQWVVAPISAPDSTFAAIAARPGGLAWAVGTAPSPQPPFAGPGSMKVSDTQALERRVPVDFGSLRGAAYDAGAGTIWAVGTQLPGQYNTPLIVSRPAQ